MERIQAAIQKAKERRGEAPPPGPVAAVRPGATGPATGSARPRAGAAAPGPAWDGLPAFAPDARLMARNRVVTFEDADPAHATFDVLRTRVLRTMKQNGWVTLGVTSPTSECGKTTTTLNLAFSIAHQADVKTVLVDLDLRRPSLATHLGLDRPQSMAGVLQGTRSVEENFVRVGDNLAIGTNAAPVRAASELLLGPATGQGLATLKAAFAPNVILFDLPPMLSGDDVMAFLPHLDCVLLVAAAERTRIDEVDKCEADLSEQTSVLGVVLNKCRYTGEEYGYY